MSQKTHFTPEQDAAILAMKHGDGPILAERWGKTRASIIVHKNYLLAKKDANKRPVGRPLRRPIPFSMAAAFARPDWFDEDLERIAKVGH